MWFKDHSSSETESHDHTSRSAVYANMCVSYFGSFSIFCFAINRRFSLRDPSPHVTDEASNSRYGRQTSLRYASTHSVLATDRFVGWFHWATLTVRHRPADRWPPVHPRTQLSVSWPRLSIVMCALLGSSDSRVQSFRFCSFAQPVERSSVISLYARTTVLWT